ncbi:MAG: ABC transporter ATP-binding protein [Lachnospiraceae bacterium]|nr:ABC transporter ATP-binding protein [Lachnospiraceae bacterium]
MKKYVCGRRVLFCATILFITLNCVFGAYFSVIIGKIVDAAGEDMNALVRAFLIGLLFVAGYVIVEIICGILKEKLTAETRRHIKRDLFSAILKKPIYSMSEASSAEYINDLSNNLNMFEQNYINAIYSLTTVITMFISASVITLTLEPFMLLVMVALALLTLLVSGNIGKPVEKRANGYMQKNAEYTAEIKDDLSASYLIRSFGITKTILHKHNNKNDAAEDGKFSLGFLQTLCSSAGDLVGLLSTVFVMSAAAYFAIKGRFSAGMIITFGSLIGQIVSPVASLPSVIAKFSAAKPINTRFAEIMADNSADDCNVQKIQKPDLTDRIEVKNVSFSYGDAPVLDKVSTVFKKGGKYAVTGLSGSGKSTLMNVVMGLLPADSGEVTYDGVNIKKLTPEDRSRIVSIVPQDSFLFNDTIRNNVTLFEKDIPDDRIIKALESAGIRGLIESLPEGLDTVVAENGSNFSGGEKQRFSLARAILRDCPVLVLDEGTSAIDTETAKQIEKKLLEKKDLTLIAITHDVSQEHLALFDGVVRVS